MIECGYITTVGGVNIHTRFEWCDFTEEWQDALIAYATSEYRNAPAGWTVDCVYIDHINVAKGTFQPRVDLRREAQ